MSVTQVISIVPAGTLLLDAVVSSDSVTLGFDVVVSADSVTLGFDVVVFEVLVVALVV